LKTDSTLPDLLAGSGLPLKASVYTVILCVLFGANAVTVKISLSGLGIFTNLGVRFFIAAAAIFLWACLSGKPIAVKRDQLYQLGFLAIIFFSQLTLFYEGLSRTTASHGTLIANVLPFVVMLLAHFFIPGDTIVFKKVLGLVLGFSGVVLLFFDSAGLTSDMLTGDLLVLAAVFVWGVNAVYTKKIIADYHPIQITLYPMMAASLFFLLCGFIWDDPMIRFLDWVVIKALFYQTFVTASFGMVAWNTLVRNYGATALHSFVFIMPISGVFLGVFILNEPVTLNLLAAVGLVVTGLVVVNMQKISPVG